MKNCEGTQSCLTTKHLPHAGTTVGLLTVGWNYIRFTPHIGTQTKPVLGLADLRLGSIRFSLIMRLKSRRIYRSDDHNAASYDTLISLIIYTLSITSKLNYPALYIYIPPAFFPEKHTCWIEHTHSRLVSWLVCGTGLSHWQVFDQKLLNMAWSPVANLTPTSSVHSAMNRLMTNIISKDSTNSDH